MKKSRLLVIICVAWALTLGGCADLLPTSSEQSLAPPTNLDFLQVARDSARISFKGNNNEDTFEGYVLYELFEEQDAQLIDSIIFDTSFVGDTAFYVRYDPAELHSWAVAARNQDGDLSELIDISSDNQTSFNGIEMNLLRAGAGTDAGLDIDNASPRIVDVQGMERHSGFNDDSGADLVFTLTDSMVIPRAVNGAALVYLGSGNDSTSFSPAEVDSIRAIIASRNSATYQGKYRVATSGTPIVIEQDTLEAHRGGSYLIISGGVESKNKQSAHIFVQAISPAEAIIDLRKQFQ
ncbi:MAG: hypothetical protein ACOC4C_05395 [Fibrobacterota bacterium]